MIFEARFLTLLDEGVAPAWMHRSILGHVYRWCPVDDDTQIQVVEQSPDWLQMNIDWWKGTVCYAARYDDATNTLYMERPYLIDDEKKTPSTQTGDEMMNFHMKRERNARGELSKYWRIWWRKIHVEIGLLRDAKHTMLQFEQNLDADDQRQISVGIKHLFNFWLGWSGVSWDYKSVGLEGMHRSIGIRVFDGGIWFDFWGDPSGYGPRREWCVFPLRVIADIVLGKSHQYRRVESERMMHIPLPEGFVPATVTREEMWQKRPRWPWRTRQRWFIDIAPDVPIPIPGKGENSWDLDDDAIYESSIHAYSYEDAVRKFVDDVIKTRLRHGGYSWRPDYRDFEPLAEDPTP